MAISISIPGLQPIQIGGAVGDFFGRVSDAITPFLENYLNTQLNISTLGLMGYGREGLRHGWTGEPLRDSLQTLWGDLTGQAQLEFFKQQVEAENLRRQMEREQMLWEQEQADIAASRAAASAAQFGAGRGRGRSLRLSSSAPYLEQDFLGL